MKSKKPRKSWSEGIRYRPGKHGGHKDGYQLAVEFAGTERRWGNRTRIVQRTEGNYKEPWWAVDTKPQTRNTPPASPSDAPAGDEIDAQSDHAKPPACPDGQ